MAFSFVLVLLIFLCDGAIMMARNRRKEKIVEKRERAIYKDDFTQYLLCLALDVGEGLLKTGAEVSRVEDTIERICYAYGAEHVEVFTIISVINAAIRMPDGSYSSQLRRVRNSTTDLGGIERYNALSREICATTPVLDEFDEKIRAVKRKKSYPIWVHYLASASAASAFAFFFGGGWKDAVGAAIAGIIIALVIHYARDRLDGLAETLIAALLTTLLSVFLVKIDFLADGGAVMIGSIMLLVPGLCFGTALRDLLNGDLLAGVMKLLQAVLLALMIAFGYMIGISITGGVV